MAEQMGFHFDASACINCKACQIACQDKHDRPAGVKPRRVVRYGGGEWSVEDGMPVPIGVVVYSVSISCMHCAAATCVDVCGAEAITKRDDGTVSIDAERCVACGACRRTCPYGAPQFNRDQAVMTKCDLCADLLDPGSNPVCVDACQMRAIEAGEIRQLRARWGELSSIEPLPPAVTGPSLVLTPHRDSQVCGKGTGGLIGPRVIS